MSDFFHLYHGENKLHFDKDGEDVNTSLDFYCDSSLKQQFTGRHVTPLGHIIPNLNKLLLLNAACLPEKQQIPIW